MITMLKATAFATLPEAVPGEFIVKLRSNLSTMMFEKQALGEKLGSYVKSTIPEYNLVVVKRASFELADAAIRTLSQNNLVEYSEPNYIYRISKLPNDPDYAMLWGLKNTGQKDSKNKVGVAGIDVSAERAWDIETGSEKTLVAVIDTGIDYNHPDLKDNVWTNESELNGKSGFDDDGNGIVDDIHGANFTDEERPTGNPLDDQGHGTHCSGTIGATGDNGQGVVGINWKVKILAAKFLDSSGSGSLEGAIKAIAYANKMGAKIMSNSWGGGGFSQALKDVIEETNKNGVVFIAAAGNDSGNNDSKPGYPASYDVQNIISVAAIDNRGALANFSNFGKKTVHLGAPGVNIYSSISDGKYDSLSGTSMATPHVSGVAALLLSHEQNLSGLEIKKRLLATTTSLPSLRGKTSTGGMLNAYNALTNTQTPVDENDPINWKSNAADIQSAHPYPAKANQTFEVRSAGAKEIALFFSRFETERNFDIVSIYDVNGKLVEQISGINNESMSAIIPGDYAKLVFTSDSSSEGFGFIISKVYYR